MKTKLKKKMKPLNRKRISASEETTFTQAVMEGLDVMDKDKIFSDAETRELFGLKSRRASVKTNFKQFYRWAEALSKRKGFSHLEEANVVRLVRESRDSLDTFEQCAQ